MRGAVPADHRDLRPPDPPPKRTRSAPREEMDVDVEVVDDDATEDDEEVVRQSVSLFIGLMLRRTEALILV